MDNSTRHKCFLSYHKEDQKQVDKFIETFDDKHDAFIYRAVREMDENIVKSTDHEYVMRRIRELYLTDSTVTIVLIGKCTWARKYVDWKIASTLRNDPNNKRSGLMAIALPSIANSTNKVLPARLQDNLDGDKKYARWWKYPQNGSILADMIEDAFQARTSRVKLVNNSRELFDNNRSCN